MSSCCELTTGYLVLEKLSDTKNSYYNLPWYKSVVV